MSPGSGTKPWSTPADVETAVRRRWRSGALLTAHAQGLPFEEISVRLRGPTATEAAADLTGVRRWAESLRRGARGPHGTSYQLETGSIGGRSLGRNEIPVRAVLTSYDEAWCLLGVREEVAELDRIRGLTHETAPEFADWVAAHPLRALDAAADWERLLGAVLWLRDHAGSGRYLRQVDVAGVDTKFIGEHQPLLAELLEQLLPASLLDPRRSKGQEFALRYGFSAPEPLVRLRFAPGTLPLPDGVSEAGLRVEELAALDASVRRVIVVENEVSYLALPVKDGTVVVFGSGYTVGSLGAVPWLAGCEVLYWGDLDTHGFAILSRLRVWWPHVRSLLMDRATLLAHRERWGREPSPTRSRLEHLTDTEQDLYQDLVEDVFAPALRLEQERLDWSYVTEALERALAD